MQNQQIFEKKTKKGIHLLWIGLFFGVFYWILDAIRDVFSYSKGTFIQRVFLPDTMTFWMRIVVVLFILLYSAYIQSIREKIQKQEFKSSAKYHNFIIIITGIFFGIIYWIFESIRGALIHENSSFILQLASPDSMSFWMRISAVGTLILFSLYIQTLANEHREIEKELMQMNLKLQEVDQLKRSFLSIVSHELKTPIAIIREGVSLCLDGIAGELNSGQKKLLDRSLLQIDRLTKLVTDLLDISQIEDDSLVLTKSTFDIRQVVKQVLKIQEVQAKANKIKLLSDYQGEHFLINADKDKVVKIFEHLIENGIRYTKSKGTVQVNLKSQEDSIECSVKDTGVGIPMGRISEAFSKFTQFDREDGPGYRGTGLGLAIVKGLVEKHGEKIEVHSIKDQGTEFIFSFRKAFEENLET